MTITDASLNFSLVNASNSKQFTFYVGSEKKEITVRHAVIAAQSSALDRLMNGHMKEAQEGAAKLENTTVETFFQFQQFAYTGDYEDASLPAVEQSPIVLTDPQDMVTFWGDDGRQKIAPKPESGSDAFFTHHCLRRIANIGIGRRASGESIKIGAFIAYSYNLKPSDFSGLGCNPPSCTRRADLYDSAKDLHPTQDASILLLAHARIYVFADQWQVLDLQALALFKVKKILRRLHTQPCHADAVAALAAFAYCNDNTPDAQAGIEPDKLRTLIMRFIIIEWQFLTESAHFSRLLMEGGEFLKDFLRGLETSMPMIGPEQKRHVLIETADFARLFTERGTYLRDFLAGLKSPRPMPMPVRG